MAAGAAVGPVTVPPAEAVEHVVVAVEHHRHVRWIHVASPSGSHGCPRTARPSMNATDWQISDHNPVADRRGPDAQRHGDAIVTIPALQAAGLSPNTFVAAARIVPAIGQHHHRNGDKAEVAVARTQLRPRVERDGLSPSPEHVATQGRRAMRCLVRPRRAATGTGRACAVGQWGPTKGVSIHGERASA